jgi:hypothetical protein
MEQIKYINELLRNQLVIKELLTGLKKEEYLWKPSANKWCLLEIICHLYDEEREDFKDRIKHVLKNPQNPLASFDQKAWVLERKYMQQKFDDVLMNFLQERDRSLDWLRSLKNPQWKNAYLHPEYGPMSANMFLINWVAHDYLHIKQILKLKFDYLKNKTGESLDYAGTW